jgi:hypothetical protein
MKKHQKLLIDNKEIYIFDNIIGKREHRELAASIQELPFQRDQSDSPQSGRIYQHYAAHLDLKAALKLGCVKETNKLIDQFFPTEKSKLRQAYINRINFGDMSFTHEDCSKESNDISAVYYLNEKWDVNWGGEIIFYENNGDALFAVTPKPGRLVLFRGAITHKIGIPNRQCLISRISLALKYISDWSPRKI